MTDITAVVNVHREGLMAHTSLLSAGWASAEAERAGLRVEILAVADRSDPETLAVLSAVDRVRVLQTDFGDLGLARNAGVASATGQFVAFLDGDDLWSENWLLLAHQHAVRVNSPTVWHPEANLLFGAAPAPIWLRHPDMDTLQGDWVALATRNHWTALSFGPRPLYEAVPFPRNRVEAGFGYEDWYWNAEVIAQGYRHSPVPGTAHLIRVRENSMQRQAAASRVLTTPSTLFRSRLGWATTVGTLGLAVEPNPAYGPLKEPAETS